MNEDITLKGQALIEPLLREAVSMLSPIAQSITSMERRLSALESKIQLALQKKDTV